jgi:hypothetical protein
MIDSHFKGFSNWWDEPETTRSHLHEVFSSEDLPLILKALKDRTCASEDKITGKPRYEEKEFLSKLRSRGIIPYFQNEGSIRCAGNGELVYWFRNSLSTVGVSWTASSAPMHDDLKALVEEWLEVIPPAEKVPPVYGFSFEHGQYMVREIGVLGDTFCADNYTPEVGTKYERILSELKKPEPAGRLVLVEGDPGTGKTRMIRALIASLKDNSKCIVVPPSLMDRLSGPEFTLSLIQQRVANNPLTLILEDADDCLIAREKNSAAKASLSALLNLSDGIMGATLDLRVIATTNQNLGDIDRAILRPGRLLERVHVGPLSAAQASEVFHRLSGGRTKTYEDSTILAQVYEDVRSSQA